MTTYRYELSIRDTEYIVLREALDMLVARCKSELAGGAEAPYIAWLQTADRLMEELVASARMSSTYILPTN